MGAKRIVTLQINGQEWEVAIRPNWTLLEVLRESLALVGTKEGCNKGDCGACTVIIEGRPVFSCLTLAVECQRKQIRTIEGLASGDQLDPVQEAFIAYEATQCGFCIPGMIMSARALLDRTVNPSLEEIKAAIGGNLCRCTGYVKIIEAIQSAAQVEAQRRLAAVPSA